MKKIFFIMNHYRLIITVIVLVLALGGAGWYWYAQNDSTVAGTSQNVNVDDTKEEPKRDLEPSGVSDKILSTIDKDGDGLANEQEERYGFNPKQKDWVLDGEDKDKDGIVDVNEEKLGTSSEKIDTDGDGVSDKVEMTLLTDPLVPDNPDTDSDEDGLSAFQEEKYKTSPTDADSDDDGYLDGEEVEHGYNPLGPGRLEEL